MTTFSLRRCECFPCPTYFVHEEEEREDGEGGGGPYSGKKRR